ncbi:toxin-antitoxin system, toxin component, HipA domain protein [delta proteobacterium NaphS2]|nr:toxin-antitoxin system, toxin component, HipA domain protein [delta proteobacterium NaphS2]
MAREFGVDAKTARRIARDVGVAVNDWRKNAARLGIGKEEIELMSSAFDHADLQKSLK